MALKSAGSSPASPSIAVTDNNYVVAHLNLALKRRNKKIYLKYTKKNLHLIRVLYKLNVINSYLNNNNSFLIITPTFFKNSPFFTHVKSVSSNRKSFYASINSLKLISKGLANSLVLLETSYGVLVHTEAIKLNTGGKVICIVS